MTEEPSYLMFARANVRDGIPTTASVVKSLIERHDTDAETIRMLVAQVERQSAQIEALSKSRTSASKPDWLKTCANCRRDIEYTHWHDSVCSRGGHCSPPLWLHFFNHQARCPDSNTFAHPLENES